MSNQMSEGDFDSIIENELVEASEDEMDALEILTSRVSLGEDAEDEDFEIVGDSLSFD